MAAQITVIRKAPISSGNSGFTGSPAQCLRIDLNKKSGTKQKHQNYFGIFCYCIPMCGIFIYGYFESLGGSLSPCGGLLLWTGLFIQIYSETLCVTTYANIVTCPSRPIPPNIQKSPPLIITEAPIKCESGIGSALPNHASWSTAVSP